MDIKIPEAQMQDIVAQAIFKTLDENARNTLIQEAITYLITKPEKKDYYAPDPKSPLQQAFHNAVGVAANKLISDQFDTDQALKEKILALFAEAMVRVFEMDRATTVQRLANAIGSAMAKD